MKTFKRSSFGISNQHLFYQADFIVFLEGGKLSYSKEEVYNGMYNFETDDVIFWRNIFGTFRPDKKIKLKSIGSKTIISEIAKDIVDGKITNCFVAMDNEFDEVLSKRIQHPNVYYTYGYSWENDVWNSDTITAIIRELSASKVDEKLIGYNFSTFKKNIKLAVYADAYLFKKSSSFFPRKSGYMFCLDITSSELPFIDKKIIIDRLKNQKLHFSTLYKYGRQNSIDAIKHCFGHFLADYCCQIVINYIKKKHELSNISKDIIYRMGINKFFQTSFVEGAIYDHYFSQFAN